MKEVVIAAACRTAIGAFGGTLRDSHAARIASVTMQEAIKRAGVEPFTIGSDAHRPEDLGAGLEDTAARLAELGIRPARFSARERIE